MRPGAIVYLVACLSLGLVSPAETRGIGSPGMGPPGPAGERGEAGAQGPQGDRGSLGVPGSPGAKGDKGDAGPQGPKGDAGAAGQPGAAGVAGERGPAGPTGATGQAGSKGDAGPQGVPGAQGPKGDTGAAGKDGLPGAAGQVGPQGSAGAPKRVERYTATSSASLTAPVATFTWPACATTPDVDVIPTWSGDQMVVGGVVSQTVSGATVAAKRSRGALLASAGPFEPAPNTPVTIRVICN